MGNKNSAENTRGRPEFPKKLLLKCDELKWRPGWSCLPRAGDHHDLVTNVGDRFKSIITGDICEVKKIVDRMVLLERKNGKRQVITEMTSLKLFYKKEETKDES